VTDYLLLKNGLNFPCQSWVCGDGEQNQWAGRGEEGTAPAAVSLPGTDSLRGDKGIGKGLSCIIEVLSFGAHKCFMVPT